jgi:hypothetical protein
MLYPSLATLALALLLAGFTRRSASPKLHAGLMSSGMAIDLALVLVLEFTKNAVGTAVGGDLTLFQRIHVASSTFAGALYLPIFALGAVRLFRPSAANLPLRTWHGRLGYAALFFRVVGYVFMFSMLGR